MASEKIQNILEEIKALSLIEANSKMQSAKNSAFPLMLPLW